MNTNLNLISINTNPNLIPTNAHPYQGVNLKPFIFFKMLLTMLNLELFQKC